MINLIYFLRTKIISNFLNINYSIISSYNDAILQFKKWDRIGKQSQKMPLLITTHSVLEPLRNER